MITYLNIREKCSLILLNISCIEVEFAMKVADICIPRGGMSHTATLMLLGIHSTKYGVFLFWAASI